MKAQDVIILSGCGFVIWVAGTIYYALYGELILETTSARYWRMFVISAIASAFLCMAILKWRNIAAANWCSAMLLLALPGMVGETIVLTNLSTFMPKLQAASGGRYAALLFATYAIVLTVAEIITLKALP